jgi:nucleotide-binding universal stress UspA family protein
MIAPEYRRILVALDNSPRAAAVLASAVEVARRFGGQLVLFRGVGIPLEIPAAALSQPPAALPQLLEATAREELMARSRDLPPEVTPTISVKLGVPWEAICRAAMELDVDLIVIGSHGFSGIDRLLGTTAARVVNHADRPVLVVRDKPRRAP